LSGTHPAALCQVIDNQIDEMNLICGQSLSGKEARTTRYLPVLLLGICPFCASKSRARCSSDPARSLSRCAVAAASNSFRTSTSRHFAKSSSFRIDYALTRGAALYTRSSRPLRRAGASNLFRKRHIETIGVFSYPVSARSVHGLRGARTPQSTARFRVKILRWLCPLFVKSGRTVRG
jgi:hypothetical protein